MIRLLPLCLLIVGFLLGGCVEKEAEKVFIIVNGKPITELVIRDAVLVRAKISELAGSPVAEKDFVRWANAMSVNLLRAYIQSSLVRDEVVRLGLESTEEDRKKALSLYNRQTKLEAKTVDELARRFGSLKDAFLDQFERTLSIATYERQYDSPNVPDFTVRQYLKSQTNRLHLAQQVDSNAWQKANAAYARLQAGEGWSKVARECSEDKILNIANKNFYKFWNVVNSNALGMKNLADVLPTMKVGDYTRPFEAQDGLLIVRFEGKEQHFYKLSRMLFRMSQPVSITKDFEKARAEVRNQIWMMKRKQNLDELRQRAKIEYPMGTNFNYKIWH